MELDLSCGHPGQILTGWNHAQFTQQLYYENTTLHCRLCHQVGHLQFVCPSFYVVAQAKVPRPKPKVWYVMKEIKKPSQSAQPTHQASSWKLPSNQPPTIVILTPRGSPTKGVRDTIMIAEMHPRG